MTKSEGVTIHGAYPLSGTLTYPEDTAKSAPAILIIPGTGKSDRDGNVKRMKMNLYKDLAEYFTSRGFITLRYDKRGTHQSGGNFYETGVYDLIDDAANCIGFLQDHPKVNKNKILILGHSEGALLAPAVHKQKPVAGLILLAGAAEPSNQLLPRQSEIALSEIEQTKGFKGWLFKVLNVTEKAKKQNKAIMKKIMESSQSVIRIKGARFPAKWIREQMRYNVCDYLEQTTCPVIAITGEKDLQVPPEQAQRIAEMVKGEAEWHIIPDMNHILRKYQGTHTMLGLIKEYKSQLNEPICPELFQTIDSWLKKRFS
ncbi:alpha/beta hydrolase family protein [Bacillus litorisediminis]|uniref:alpha/beta hydrolase family protein n=1 Tax=Bacillus litorisediminis TaxID=2922713 RepID=UPI001FAC40B9|nr:alpha/beta hydrolase [Bacillus litorisediminis]